MLSGIIFSVIIHSDVQLCAILQIAILLSVILGNVVLVNVVLVNVILSIVMGAECFLNSDCSKKIFFQFKTKLRLSC
jgi:hypothetical protein